MELILWRHAEAEEGFPDMERKLTAKGRKQADKMATFLHTCLPSDTRILVSPALRTQQTAEALSKRYTMAPAIAPGASPDALLTAADWPDGDGCVLIVGHQPTLGQVVERLLGGSAICYNLKKGAVWWLSRRERNCGCETSLRLVISPEFL